MDGTHIKPKTITAKGCQLLAFGYLAASVNSILRIRHACHVRVLCNKYCVSRTLTETSLGLKLKMFYKYAINCALQQFTLLAAQQTPKYRKKILFNLANVVCLIDMQLAAE